MAGQWSFFRFSENLLFVQLCIFRSYVVFYGSMGTKIAKNQVAFLEAILERKKKHELSKKIQKIQHNTFCCSVEKFNSWSGDPPRTRRARAPNETPPSGNHHILSPPPHRTTSLVNRERCTGDAKLDGSRMESSAGWLTVNCR